MLQDFKTSAGNKHVMVEHKLFEELETFFVAPCTCSVFFNKTWSQSHWIRHSSPKSVVEDSPLFNRHVFAGHLSDFFTLSFTKTFHLSQGFNTISLYICYILCSGSHGCRMLQIAFKTFQNWMNQGTLTIHPSGVTCATGDTLTGEAVPSWVGVL